MPTRFLTVFAATLALVLTGAASASAVTLKQNNTDDAWFSTYCPIEDSEDTRTTYLRRFDLVDDHGITGPFRVTSISFGVRLAHSDTGSQTVRARVYTVPADADRMTRENMVLVADEPVTLANTDPGGIVTVPLSATIAYPEDYDLVIAVADLYEAGTRFVLRANDDGESAPSYFQGCYYADPVESVVLHHNNPALHWVLWADGEHDPTVNLFANDAPPTITGAAKVGETLTAHGGDWTPDPTTSTFQWYREGYPIEGATDPSLVIAPFLRGSQIAVVETVSRSGYAPRSRASAPTASVVRGDFATVTPPAISGTPRVGETLTASDGTWSPAPESRSFQWYVGGAAVNGATGATFIPRPEDVGKSVHVVEGVAATGYNAGNAASASVGPVVPGVITNTVLPVITGGTRVLDALSVSPGTWVPPDADLAYQWLADGEEIPGATGSSYDLRPADLDRSVSVEVTASKPGYDPTTVEAVAVGPVQRCEFALGRAPTVLGEVAVGETVEAVTGDWRPVPGAVSYQWFADGAAIAGATAASYALRPGDLGKRITVRVDVTAEGCVDATATSGQTPAVGEGEMRVVTRPRLDGHPVLGEPVTVTAGEWEVDPATVSYQWLRGGEPIPGAAGATYVPTPEDVTKWLSVVVTVSAPGYAPREVTTAAAFPVSPVVGENLVRPRVIGSPVAGATLSMDPGEWSFDPERVQVRWYAGDRRIEGATGAELVLDDPDLVGEAISVRVTVSSEVQPPVSATSASTAAVRKAAPGLEVELSTRTPQVRETRVGVEVSVTAPRTLPVEGDLRVLVDGGLVVTRAVGDGSLRVVLPVFRTPGRHRVVVRYDGSDLLLTAATRTVVRARR